MLICKSYQGAATCDEAHQLLIGFDSDPNMPFWLVPWGLQCPLQELTCVFESAQHVCIMHAQHG